MRIISGTARGTKLYTLEGLETRPTLDRVKEALFSKINEELSESVILDLFSGSGALALESLSRGAQKAYIVDNSFKAIKIINQNITKTRFQEKCVIIQKDYLKALEEFKNKDISFDIVFLDPPYKTDYAIKSVNLIMEKNLLNRDGFIVIETDSEKEILEGLKDININVYDVKKYGRVPLIFINRKG